VLAITNSAFVGTTVVSLANIGLEVVMTIGIVKEVSVTPIKETLVEGIAPVIARFFPLSGLDVKVVDVEVNTVAGVA